MRRREFITLLGGAAARGRSRRVRSSPSGCGASACSSAWPRTIRKRRPACRRSCRGCRNWAGPKAATCGSTSAGPLGDADRTRKYAAELVALAPDVILATGSTTVGPLLQATRTVPIVFMYVPDPVGAGFVDSLARPGGNATGFTAFEYGISAKWLELLKEIAPRRDASGSPSGPRHNRRDRPIRRDPVRGAVAWGGGEPGQRARRGEIERAVAAFARSSNGGLIVTGSALAIVHRDLIITLAARHKLPAVYFERFFVAGGGLISYGTDMLDQYRRAAGYVDRILKGEKPADLPVQAPTKYELAINLKTAKALGLELPPTARARRRGDRMRRREFITLLGGAAAAWPLAARAQQGERMRRIGVLMSLAADDPEGQARIAAFLQALQQLGWTDGRNVRIDTRWAAGDADRIRRYAAELVALAPDVILASGASTVGPLLQATRTVPIVFAQVADPVGAGFVDSLARPGGNATGFITFEYGISGKWLELLKEIAPGVTRVAVLRDPAIAAGIGQFARHPVGGAVVRGGVEPGQCARRRRDRARRRGIRALRRMAA